MTNTDVDHAREQARAQLDSIIEMLTRLDHAQECDGGDDCDLDSDMILDGLGYYHADGSPSTAEEFTEYHDEDKARDAIDEDPLSVEVRSGWHTPGEEAEDEEFNILLCTGGPAVRITGSLDNGEPYDARLEYQDWFTPWTEYQCTRDEEATLVRYASNFLSF